MIDQSSIDLPALIRQSTALHASHHELRGRCPFHQGKSDTSLKVWQEDTGWRWCCHAGCGGGDPLRWVAVRDGLDLKRADHFRHALTALDLTANAAPRPVADPQPTEPTTAPPDTWQAAGKAFVETCADALWSDYTKPLDWLMGRGFRNGVLAGYDIGYNADDHYVRRADWGLPNVTYTDDNGERKEKTAIWLPRGIVIPWFVGGDLWKIIIRRPTGTPKYYQVTGGSNCLYNADRIRPALPVMLCEATLDVLAVQQEASDLVTPVATGTTGARCTRWIAPLASARARLLSFDQDSGGDNPLAYWRGVFPDAKEWRPYYDDPATMLETGGDLRAWVRHGLTTH